MAARMIAIRHSVALGVAAFLSTVALIAAAAPQGFGIA